MPNVLNSTQEYSSVTDLLWASAIVRKYDPDALSDDGTSKKWEALQARAENHPDFDKEAKQVQQVMQARHSGVSADVVTNSLDNTAPDGNEDELNSTDNAGTMTESDFAEIGLSMVETLESTSTDLEADQEYDEAQEGLANLFCDDKEISASDNKKAEQYILSMANAITDNTEAENAG